MAPSWDLNFISAVHLFDHPFNIQIIRSKCRSSCASQLSLRLWDSVYYSQEMMSDSSSWSLNSHSSFSSVPFCCSSQREMVCLAGQWWPTCI